MAEGLYRIGECIYMEVYPPPIPYQICKIEELRKNTKGSVEVAAKCFYRRKDLPSNLLAAADRHAMAVGEENEMETGKDSSVLCNNFEKLGELELHLIRHRELFLSRQIETYKIDMVRGKCTVSLLNELEDIHTYLDNEDTFFFTMVYDPNQRTLLVDKGEIRVGTDYQAEIPPYVDPEGREPVSHQATQVWEPNRLPDTKVEQFLVVARSIGTFARALLDGAKKPQISLRLGAAAASRDITLFHAMDTLHQNTYNITQATSCLVPRGPVLCADELEAWTQEEAKRFEDGLQEQKDFVYIQRKYLPWKPVKSIVAYYYMWKTTDRYQIQKRHRMIEKQNDLKEVIVHLRTSSNHNLSGKAASSGVIPKAIPDKNEPVAMAQDGEKGCESCRALSASRWYQWGNLHEHRRLCNHCYTYWRKYGGLKLPSELDPNDKKTSASGVGGTQSAPKKPKSERTSGKKRGEDKRSGDIIPPIPFFMKPTGMSLYMRKRVGRPVLVKHARSPMELISIKDTSKPEAVALSDFLAAKRKGFRKPRLSEPMLASLKLNVQQSPVRTIRPSPTPISPSYKAKANTKSNKGRVTTSGTYVPPKSQMAPSTTTVAAVAPPQTTTKPPPTPTPAPKPSTQQQQQQQSQQQQQQQQLQQQKSQQQQQVSMAGVFLPKDAKADSQSRKRKPEEDSGGAVPPSKVARSTSSFIIGPELLFKADSKAQQAREKLGRIALLKAARSPTKAILRL